MSVHSPAKILTQRSLSVTDIRAAKGIRKLTMLTAYDFLTARLLDRTETDMLLVGDSLGMVMLGQEDTLSVTIDDMIHHTRAVMRGAGRALVVADLPFMSYEPDSATALRNATRLFKESGVRAVKLEGAYTEQVRALTQAGIPVMGHLGLTPQRVAQLGGFKVQARQAQAAHHLVEAALALEAAGCFSLVLEAIPAPLARIITQRLSIPTIGIGAGNACDGQVLVLHDMLGMYTEITPRFVKKYAEIGKEIECAVQSYIDEVRNGDFPAAQHSFSMNEEELALLDSMQAEAAGTASGPHKSDA